MISDHQTDRLRTISRHLAPFFLCPLVVACAAWRADYFETTVPQASQEDMIRLFGYPQRIRGLDGGNTVWEYDFLGTGDRCASYRVTFDGQGGLQHWERLGCR